MRHRIAGRKLGRTTSHRIAMLRNLVTSLVEHERVKTTDAKAKEVRPLAEKLIGLAKRGDLHARRQALSVVRKPELVKKLFETLSPRYQSRTGGYLRIVKVGYRAGGRRAGFHRGIDRREKEGGKKAKAKKKREKVKRAERTKLPQAASKT